MKQNELKRIIDTAKSRIRSISIEMEGLKEENSRLLRLIETHQQICRHYRASGTKTCIYCGKVD